MADIKDEQRKMHGDKLSEVVKGHQADAVPGDDNAHAHSHAAHLAVKARCIPRLKVTASRRGSRAPGTSLHRTRTVTQRRTRGSSHGFHAVAFTAPMGWRCLVQR